MSRVISKIFNEHLGDSINVCKSKQELLDLVS